MVQIYRATVARKNSLKQEETLGGTGLSGNGHGLGTDLTFLYQFYVVEAGQTWGQLKKLIFNLFN